VKNDSHNDAHNDTQNDGRNGDGRYRRVEFITGTTRHVRRSDDERARILCESFEPGANIAAVARRNGVNAGLLHYWRKRAKVQTQETSAPEPPLFIPVAIAMANEPAIEDATCVGAAASGPVSRRPAIEIETAGARVLVPVGVDAKTLSVVLAALRRTP
jgi:transposase